MKERIECQQRHLKKLHSYTRPKGKCSYLQAHKQQFLKRYAAICMTKKTKKVNRGETAWYSTATAKAELTEKQALINSTKSL